MAGHSGCLAGGTVEVNGSVRTFTQQLTAMSLEVPNEVAPFQAGKQRASGLVEVH
jgi:hypothetical protein